MTYGPKVLCIGDNSSEEARAHHLTKKLAEKEKSTFRGQLTSIRQLIEKGYYHTDLVTLKEKDIIEVFDRFNDVILLDQGVEEYSHAHIFTSTWKLIKHLTKVKNKKIHILNPKNTEFLDYWDKVLADNPSFCLYPWIKSVAFNDHHTLCTQSPTPVTKIGKMKNWKDDHGFNQIRKKMLKGEKIVNCEACYGQERIGKGVSIRKHETIEWAALLNLKSQDELKNISSPSYFELRFSNKCNIKCRSCNGHFSHLIQKETKTIKDEEFQNLVDEEKYSQFGGDEIIDWTNLKRVYIGGGESTVQPELYQFMRNCIKHNNTDFEFRIGTNGVKISKPLVQLFSNFKNLSFSVSTDGTPKIDEYIRWGTIADEKKRNIEMLKQQGHPIAINFVLSIWNVSYIGEILEYFDLEFPDSPMHMNVAGYKNDILSPFIFADKQIIIESVEKAVKTQKYLSNEQRTKNLIDSIGEFYSSSKEINLQKLKKFFYYNDTLDRVRGSKLEDYIPRLEKCRKFVS